MIPNNAPTSMRNTAKIIKYSTSSREDGYTYDDMSDGNDGAHGGQQHVLASFAIQTQRTALAQQNMNRLHGIFRAVLQSKGYSIYKVASHTFRNHAIQLLPVSSRNLDGWCPQFELILKAVNQQTSNYMERVIVVFQIKISGSWSSHRGCRGSTLVGSIDRGRFSRSPVWETGRNRIQGASCLALGLSFVTGLHKLGCGCQSSVCSIHGGSNLVRIEGGPR
jgi:hypothetical protein